MAWVEMRIREYSEGQQPTFIEWQILSVTHPVALLLAMIGLLMLLYGLWVHAWLWIALGVVVYLLGFGYGHFRGWPARKFELCRHGEQLNWLEQRILEHAHPVHFILAFIGMVMIVYGLWIHDWFWIIAGIILNLGGHVYTWLRE